MVELGSSQASLVSHLASLAQVPCLHVSFGDSLYMYEKNDPKLKEQTQNWYHVRFDRWNGVFYACPE